MWHVRGYIKRPPTNLPDLPRHLVADIKRERQVPNTGKGVGPHVVAHLVHKNPPSRQMTWLVTSPRIESLPMEPPPAMRVRDNRLTSTWVPWGIMNRSRPPGEEVTAPPPTHNMIRSEVGQGRGSNGHHTCLRLSPRVASSSKSPTSASACSNPGLPTQHLIACTQDRPGVSAAWHGREERNTSSGTGTRLWLGPTRGQRKGPP
jgi:hypothetical protein